MAENPIVEINKTELRVNLVNQRPIASFVKVTTKGDRGDKGERGDQGPAGAAGANGRDGVDGINGLNGRDGIDGQDGSAATIQIGTVTTLPAGSTVVVQNVGTATNAILNFSIPKGDQGVAGQDGADGTAAAAQALIDAKAYTDNSVANKADKVTSVLEIDSDYTVKQTDNYIAVNNLTQNIIITLPSASLNAGKQYTIKKICDCEYTISVATSVDEIIEDDTVQIISDQWVSMTIISNGIKWLII